MDIAVDVTGLTVERGHRPVLDTLSCRIGRGRVTGLLGPSGAGKSTLIRCIVGVQKTKAGSVTVLGEPAGSLTIRRRLGYMSQAPSIYPDLTVLENVCYFAALVGAGRDQARSVIAEVGLAAAEGQVVGTLSGGQRSRASLACALVGSPDVLVLDEPTVGQDPVLREELWQALRLRADSGTTIIVSSHVMDEANRCEQLLLIRDGRLLADDTPAAVKASAGTDDLDEAFLTLIRRREQVAA
jgi:ABC-2 type transport system ATP-binding protein